MRVASIFVAIAAAIVTATLSIFWCDQGDFPFIVAIAALGLGAGGAVVGGQPRSPYRAFLAVAAVVTAVVVGVFGTIALTLLSGCATLA